MKVTLGEIRPVVESMVTDINNPTDQEVLSVVDHFLYNATKLTVINEDIATEELTEETETSICVGGENGNILTATQTQMETLTSEVVGNSLQPINSDIDTVEELEEFYQHPALFTPSEETLPQSNSLATATKSELVFTTATSLGITLNTSEIELIASNVNNSSDDLTDSLDEIKGAIIAFIRHKIAVNRQKIDDTLEEITQVATDGFNANSQQLTDGLQNINHQLQQQSQDFKSKVKSTIKCFQLPAAS